LASIVLLNIGLAGAFFTILLRSPWKLAFALITTCALVLFGWELNAILRARKRRTLDWGIRYFLTAIVLFGPLSAIALVLSFPAIPLTRFTGQLENLYGFLGLLGAVSLSIIGMLYKIIPFLVWFGRYSPHVGRAKVPALAELYSAPLQAAGYFGFLLGFATTGVAILMGSETAVRVGCSVLFLGLLPFAANIGFMLSHFFRPRLRPLGPNNVPLRVEAETNGIVGTTSQRRNRYEYESHHRIVNTRDLASGY
jgi:hypothetical protein